MKIDELDLAVINSAIQNSTYELRKDDHDDTVQHDDHGVIFHDDIVKHDDHTPV